MGAIFSCFSAKSDTLRESFCEDSESAGSTRPYFSKKDGPISQTEDNKANGDANGAWNDTEEWALVDLEEEDAQKHKISRETKPIIGHVPNTGVDLTYHARAEPVLCKSSDVAAIFRGSVDSTIYHGDHVVSEFATKIFHHNAEDWRHFQTTLDQEYKDQIQEPFYRAPTVDLRTPSSASSHTNDRRAGNDPDMSSEVAWIDHACNKNTSNSTSMDLEKQNTVDYIRELVNRLVYRVEKEVLLKQLMEEAGDQESIVSDDKERDKRQAHPGGRCRDAVKKNIAWTVDITPPNTAWPTLDPDISEAFQKEYSKIVAQREQEKRQESELAAPSCRPVNSPARGPISHGCRIPVPVTGTSYRQCETISRGCHVPLSARQNVGPIYKQRSQGSLELDPVTKREVEFFKRTQLFRERVRMNKTWQRGLTPLQIWVVKNHSDDIQEEPPRPSPPKKKTRTAPVKCKISCWRK